MPIIKDPDSKKGSVTGKRILKVYEKHLLIIIEPRSVFF